MATQTVSRTHNHRSTLVLLSLAGLIATLIVAGLLLLRSAPSTTESPPPAAPGTQSLRTFNRSFADEIAGASALDMTSAASAMQPEWDVVQPRPAALAALGTQSLRTFNRSFADEIAGAGAGIADWTLPEVPATHPRHGPR